MRLLLSLTAFAFSAFAQTITTTDPNGDTVVEVATVDNAGNPLTETISTITAGVVAGPDPAQQGPVGVPLTPTPPPGTGAPPITFTYTTTNAEGDTIKPVQLFTPIPYTPLTTPVSSGTIWDYTQYTAQFGGNIATQKSTAMSLSPQWRLPLTGLLCTFVGLLVGGVMVVPVA